MGLHVGWQQIYDERWPAWQDVQREWYAHPKKKRKRATLAEPVDTRQQTDDHGPAKRRPLSARVATGSSSVAGRPAPQASDDPATSPGTGRRRPRSNTDVRVSRILGGVPNGRPPQ